MKREGQLKLASILLLFWGAIMLYFYASGRINSYLTGDGGFRVTVLIAGVIMVMLALFNLFTSSEKAACNHEHHNHDDHDHAHDEDCEHDHDHPPLGNGRLAGVLAACLLLIVPIGTAAFFTPDKFSAQAVLNKQTTLDASSAPTKLALDKGVAGVPAPGTTSGDEVPVDVSRETLKLPTFTLADLDAQVDKSPEGNYLLEVPELFYTAGDREVRVVVEGLPIETVGQVMPGNDGDEEGNRPRIFRLYIDCCIADARPVSIPIEFSGDRPELRELSWIRIVGKMTYPMEEGLVVPLLHVDSLEEADEPDDAMLY